MLVSVETMAQAPRLPLTVRVHSPVGSAVVVWCGDPAEANGRHHVEWTVNEDLQWERNTQSTALAEPGLWQDGDLIVLRGRLGLDEDCAATLELGDALILFDLVAPFPDGTAGGWVEIRVARDSVTLWPFQG
ncbi:hypothetical protein OG883_03475 [Streptomyces sp. NBC_01142]|uniref:hypothetical protein n=1 Tax=Streptomyces sp. NBC_01142 TaxID=2975865 RepID=UPI00224ECF46|nr:hypothetical protein [Streptomyces sp. NBC_01142]MCX4818979.1 hypothetical protein [Streptomyces sp. NBC_01142]